MRIRVRAILALALVGALLPTTVHAVGAASPSAASASTSGAGLSAASVKISWAAVTGAVGYKVTATDPDNSTVSQTVPYVPSAGNYQATFAGLKGGSPHNFVVTTIDQNGATQDSAQVPFTAQSIPDVPTAGTSTPAPGSVALTWTAPVNNGGLPITGYTISEKTLTSVTVSGTTLTKTITGLTPGVKYSFSRHATILPAPS